MCNSGTDDSEDVTVAGDGGSDADVAVVDDDVAAWLA
jgi:hypothetical protein